MTKHENKIPIKGYATFDPLKHCVIGSAFKTEWFSDLDIYKNNKIMDPLKKHKVEPIVFNFRHRYFWDGGIHCITQDLYREGTMEDYFG